MLDSTYSSAVMDTVPLTFALVQGCAVDRQCEFGICHAAACVGVCCHAPAATPEGGEVRGLAKTCQAAQCSIVHQHSISGQRHTTVQHLSTGLSGSARCRLPQPAQCEKCAEVREQPGRC